MGKVHKTEPNEVQQLDLIFEDYHFLIDSG